MAPAPARLYADREGAVMVVDIAASIEHGQNTPFRLHAPAALDQPYRSTEPQGGKRQAALEALPTVEREYHDAVQRAIGLALTQVRACWPGPSGVGWCHARRLPVDAPCHPKILPPLAPAIVLKAPTAGHQVAMAPLVLSTTDPVTRWASLHELWGHMVCHAGRDHAVLSTADAGDFIIPAGACFLLSTMAQGRSSFLCAHQHLLGRAPRFDLVLMDPPWPNRSVRHARAYRTGRTAVMEPFGDAVQLLRDCLAPQGQVAVWVTNKPAVRTSVVDALQALGLHALEEWVWIKTTAAGDPVTPLDGVWRRPYEVLLLFGRPEGQSSAAVRRRVICGVPTFHSQKPCLKELLESVLSLPPPPQCLVLELFARNLTAGWWSWGDQVLQYQHTDYWAADTM